MSEFELNEDRNEFEVLEDFTVRLRTNLDRTGTKQEQEREQEQKQEHLYFHVHVLFCSCSCLG